MCGIAGIYNANPMQESADWRLMQQIISDQETRGPDHQDIIAIENSQHTTFFGHNRLSIIDLTENGHQPMWDIEQELCIVYNGQIYNYLEIKTELVQLGYRFATLSDTEVVLRAFKYYREKCVEHFNGMFAFAIYEKTSGKIWLFRDRFGVKPLFYKIDNNKLYFASSSNVLAKHFALKPDINYLTRGLNFRFYENGSSETAYQGLFSLPGGHYLSANLSAAGLQYKIENYYDLSERVINKQQQLADLSDATLTEQAFALLQQAITLRLRADTPLGVTLSGGLDSSSIAALMKSQLRDHALTAFSFGSPTAKQSEGPVVAALSKHIGIETHYVMPNVTDFADTFWHTLRAQDAPFTSCSIIAQYFVYKTARARGVKVLLGGQGADEVFLGYRKFQFYYLQQLLRQKQYARSLSHATGMLLSLCYSLPQLKSLSTQIYRHIKKDGISTKLVFPELEHQQHLLRTQNQPLTSALCARSLDDTLIKSLPTLLRYEDRNSMANSIESRLPFLDYQLIEFALALPDALKIRHGFGKWIVRDMMQAYLPNQVRISRIKRGFDANDAHWLSGGLAKVLRNALNEFKNNISIFLPKDLTINHYFSDDRLKTSPNVFAEAVTLIWLGTKSYG